jgi:hypothetical protein
VQLARDLAARVAHTDHEDATALEANRRLRYSTLWANAGHGSVQRPGTLGCTAGAATMPVRHDDIACSDIPLRPFARIPFVAMSVDPR